MNPTLIMKFDRSGRGGRATCPPVATTFGDSWVALSIAKSLRAADPPRRTGFTEGGRPECFYSLRAPNDAARRYSL